MITKNVLIFFILACTLSCTGKNDAKETQDTYTEKTQDVDSDWVLYTSLLNNRQGSTGTAYQVDSYNNICSQVVKDFLSVYNIKLGNHLEEYWDTVENQYKEYGKKYSIVSDSINSDNRILKSVQHVKVPPLKINMNPKRTPIVFFAEYSDQYDLYNSETSLFLLIFFEDDGIAFEFEWKDIGYSMKDIPIVNSANHIKYHWINDMPDKSFKNNSAIIRDFNGDGYDEIMLFHRGSGNDFLEGTIFCSILSFFEEIEGKGWISRGFKSIFTAPLRLFLHYSIEKWDFGPPIQFGAYKGIEGFIIYEDVPTGKTAKQWVGLDPDEPFYDDWYEEFQVTEGIWNFYAWNKEGKKYAFIDRVNPDEIKTQWAKIKKSRE